MRQSESPTLSSPQTSVSPWTGRRPWILLHLAALLFFLVKWVANSGLHPGDMVMVKHDYLDSFPGWYEALKTSGVFFGQPFSKVNALFNGLPRSCLKSPYKPEMILFYFLSFPWAHSLCLLLSWIASYFSFMAISSELTPGKHRAIRFVAALGYASVPVYPGSPFLASALCMAARSVIRFFRGRLTFSDGAVFFIVPFVTPVSLGTYMLLCFEAGAVLVALVMRRFRSALLLSLGFALSLTGTVLSEIHLFLEVFRGWTFIPNRVEAVYWKQELSLRRMFDFWVNGQYHTPTHAFPWTASIVALGIACAAVKRNRLLGAIMGLILSAAVLGIAAVCYLHFRPLISGDHLLTVALRMFNLSRLTGILPLLWALAGLLGLVALSDWTPGLRIGILLGLIHVGSLFFDISYTEDPEEDITFNDFFIPEVFECVDQHLPPTKWRYRVVSLGLLPSIALHHGYSTLDGYVGIYPLEYKDTFRKIIKREMRKRIGFRVFFNRWGNHVYLISDEIGRRNMVSKSEGLVVEDLEIWTRQLYRMRGRFLLSAVEIGNAPERRLRLIHRCSHPDRDYEVFIYRLMKKRKKEREKVPPGQHDALPVSMGLMNTTTLTFPEPDS